MGLAKQIAASNNLGVMGVSFDADESIAAEAGQPYPNVISQMVSQGVINTRAYSLWLNKES
jgi:Eukaryotic aspartyl protease